MLGVWRSVGSGVHLRQIFTHEAHGALIGNASLRIESLIACSQTKNEAVLEEFPKRSGRIGDSNGRIRVNDRDTSCHNKPFSLAKEGGSE